ncbi:MAG: O-methyltransferase [Vicinamibacterales bacterium]
MDDNGVVTRPTSLEAIERDTAAIGFGMASEAKTGSLLRALAASKPAGKILELGTGTGVGTAWLLAGMDADSRLVSVDNDARAQEIARRHLGADPRVTFRLTDGAEFLKTLPAHAFDLVFADTWAGKFTHVDEALDRVRVGGFYLVDDLLPQVNWPDGHAAKVPPLIRELETRSGFAAVKLAWATGLIVLVRTHTA